jgi:hypothetical protein
MTLEMGQVISPEWLIAVGCALRGRRSKSKLGEKEITLLGEPWENRFNEEQLVGFLNFWRVLVPVVMGILVVVFLGAASFLANAKMSIESEVVGGNSQQVTETAALEASSTQFNAMVAMIQNIEQSAKPVHVFLAEMTSLAAANQVSIDHLSVPGVGAPVTLSGEASSEDRILAFKNALESNASFSSINLPLTQIQQNGTNFSFTMTFVYTQ